MDGDIKDGPIDYVTLLERTNLILLEGLKKSMELLCKVSETRPDSSSWQELVQQFHAIIHLGEEVCAKGSLEGTEKVSIV